MRSMKEDKNKLEPMLRAFKGGHITLEYAVDFILRIYSVSIGCVYALVLIPVFNLIFKTK